MFFWSWCLSYSQGHQEGGGSDLRVSQALIKILKILPTTMKCPRSIAKTSYTFLILSAHYGILTEKYTWTSFSQLYKYFYWQYDCYTYLVSKQCELYLQSQEWCWRLQWSVYQGQIPGTSHKCTPQQLRFHPSPLLQYWHSESTQVHLRKTNKCMAYNSRYYM